MKVIEINGGIGRCICALPALESLSKNFKVIIITTFPEVFENNPCFERVYPITNKYLWEDVISINEFIRPEPYTLESYYKNKIHLIEAFAKILNVEIINRQSNLQLSEEEIQFATDYLERIKDGRKIALFQPFGGSARFRPVVWKNRIPQNLSPGPVADSIKEVMKSEYLELFDTTYRSLSSQIAMQIVTKIKNFKLVYMGTVDFKVSGMETPNFNLRQWIALISQIDYIISVDSCSQHIGYIYNKPGVIIWGSTSEINLGYKQYKNFHHQSFRTYNPFRFNCATNFKNKNCMKYNSNELKEIIHTIDCKLKSV